jgi:hypothetical protein
MQQAFAKERVTANSKPLVIQKGSAGLGICIVNSRMPFIFYALMKA